MLADMRYTKIIELLNQNESVRVAELSQLLNVTEKTIREDLEKLDKKGILKRVHGGAILVEGNDAMLPITKRQTKQKKEKEEIAHLAFQYIEDGQTILLDGGSTTFELAKLLVNRNLTVITNDIKIAAVFADDDTVNLIILGGHKRKGSSAIVGVTAMEMVRNFNIDIAFIGTTGVDVKKGLSLFNLEEAEYKKVMIQSAKTIFLLADCSKFNRTALVSFGYLNDIHFVITDSNTDEETLSQIKKIGVNVIQVQNEVILTE